MKRMVVLACLIAACSSVQVPPIPSSSQPIPEPTLSPERGETGATELAPPLERQRERRGATDSAVASAAGPGCPASPPVFEPTLEGHRTPAGTVTLDVGVTGHVWPTADGMRVVYIVERDGVATGARRGSRAGPARAGLLSALVTGGDVRTLVEPSPGWFSVRPDSLRVYFPVGQHDIASVPITGGPSRTEPVKTSSGLQFTPDSRWMVAIDPDRKSTVIYPVGRGRALRRPFADYHPQFRNGLILFNARPPEVVNPETGAVLPMPVPGGLLGFHHNRAMMMVFHEGTRMVVRVDGEGPSTIPTPGVSHFTDSKMTPDGRGVVLVSDARTLHYYDIDGGFLNQLGDGGDAFIQVENEGVFFTRRTPRPELGPNRHDVDVFFAALPQGPACLLYRALGINQIILEVAKDHVVGHAAWSPQGMANIGHAEMSARESAFYVTDRHQGNTTSRASGISGTGNFWITDERILFRRWSGRIYELLSVPMQ